MPKRDRPNEPAAVLGPILKTAHNEPITRETSKSAEFVSLYANDVQVQTTPWDMRLLLGEISDPPSPESPTLKIQQLGELRISPQLAKRLTLIMLDQIKVYEESFGEIPGPKE